MEFDVLAYLAGKGFRPRLVSGRREALIPCFADCMEPRDSAKRKMYVSVEEGTWYCHRCQCSGGAASLQRHFGDTPATDRQEDPFVRRRILDKAVAFYQDALTNRPDVLDYLLHERGLTPETIVERKLGFAAAGWSLRDSLGAEFSHDQLLSTGLFHKSGPRAGEDFFQDRIIIPIVSRGHVIQVRGRAWGNVRGGKYMSGPDEVVRAFNIDSLDDVEDVILVEGEGDCMILAQELVGARKDDGRRIGVVGLPGVSAWPSDLDDRLGSAKRIYIGFDADDAGRKAAERLQERLGKRARIVAIPDEGADWTDWLLPVQDAPGWEESHPHAGHTASDVLSLLRESSGRRIFTVAEFGERYREYRLKYPGLKTGYRRIDELLAPGLMPGQVVFILAATNVGKSVMCCNLAYQMRRHRILFITLEMTGEEMYLRLERIYYFFHPRASREELEFAMSSIYICDEDTLGERDLEALILEFEDEAGAKPEVIIIDYLGYFAQGLRGQSDSEKTAAAARLSKKVSKRHRSIIIAPQQVTGVAPGQPVETDNARDSKVIGHSGDAIIGVWNPDEASSENLAVAVRPRSRQIWKLLKSRHGNKGQMVTMVFDKLTLALVPEDDPLASTVDQHNFMHWRGHRWEDLRAEQTRPVQGELHVG